MINFPNLGLFDKFALDTETTGLNWRKDKIFGFSISTPDGEDYYWDVRENPKSLDWLRDQIKCYEGLIVNHNMKFDAHFLGAAGINLINKNIDCTMVRAALIDEHRLTYNLDDVAKYYLGLGKLDPYTELAEMFGGKATRNTQIGNLHKAPISLVSPYAKRDTRAALDLWGHQQGIIKSVNMYKICDLEKDVLPVIIDMEKDGVRVDIDQAEKTVYTLDRSIDKEQTALNKLAGFRVNPNPSGSIHKLFTPKQDSEGIWRAKDGTLLASTPAGKASISSEALMAMKHPAAAAILHLRKMMKCRDTFIKGHILASAEGDRVYPNINQCKSDSGGTVTGRLSVTQPALQQIPSRDIETSAIVRPLFLPDYDQRWYCADYSQADARGFAHYTQSPPLLAAYAKDKFTDFHSLTARLTGLPRNASEGKAGNAKQLGLGLLFSMGEGRMAKEMGLPCTEKPGRDGKVWLKPGPEAEAIFVNFHNTVPGVKEFAKKATSVAASRGYIISLMGRHLHFPKGQFTYKAAGYLFQSATAEFNKVKMVDTWRILKGSSSSLRLSVHDELNFSSDDPELMKKAQIEMEDFNSEKARIKLRIPMVAEMNNGRNWYEAK